MGPVVGRMQATCENAGWGGGRPVREETTLGPPPMARIYVSQTLVDQWLSSGRVHLDGDLLHVDVGGTEVALFIDPAVLFESADGTGTDPLDIVGRVKNSQELAELGAEHFDTSVVIGELAYTVRPGFLAVPVAADGTERMLDAPAWARLAAALIRLAA